MNDTMISIIAQMKGLLQQDANQAYKAQEIGDDYSQKFYENRLLARLLFANDILEPYGLHLLVDHWTVKHEEI